MTVLSFSAYALWVLLAAVFLRAGRCGASRGEITPEPLLSGVRHACAICLPGGAFFFLPPGSLPPFFDVPFGGVAVVSGLLAGAFCLRQKRAHMACGVIGAVAFVFFLYARHRGMPGSFANLGAFVAMPVWGIASLPEMCGFILLAAGFFAACASSVPDEKGCLSFAATVWTLAASALFVTLFLPWNAAPHVAWPDAAAAGCDFILFWLKVFCCGLCFLLCPPLAVFRRWLPFLCCGIGALFVFSGAG